MNVPELSQIVVDPEDSEEVDMALLGKNLERDPVWPLIKAYVGRALHPFGVHTWVRWLHYDVKSDRVIDMNGRICQWCPKGKMR